MPGAVSHHRLARRNRGNAKKKRKKKYRRRPIAPRARVSISIDAIAGVRSRNRCAQQPGDQDATPYLAAPAAARLTSPSSILTLQHRQRGPVFASLRLGGHGSGAVVVILGTRS